MALIGWEIVVVVLVAVVFLWGPQKLPELARALGTAKREYEEAQKARPDESRPDQN